MPRAIWKGAVSFGLVHIPVAMYPASDESSIDFDWLDQRSMDPVGYKRINKRTGKDITGENIVKGIKQKSGEYVVLSDKEIKAAYPKATQTIEIEAFVDAKEIAFTLLERPYFLEPGGKAGKVYRLLREAMEEAQVIGIARIVLHTKEHLAALMPAGDVLVLNTLRWPAELRDAGELELPAVDAAAKPKPAEKKMAARLIEDMRMPWKPESYEDHFTAAIEKLVAHKIKAGDTEVVKPLESITDAEHGNVVDLTELLSRSLGAKRPSKATEARTPTRVRRRANRRSTR